MSEAAAPATAPVKGLTSAYMFFQSDQYNNHKEELAQVAGLRLGDQGAEISRRWRSLSPEERSKFDALADKDRERHRVESEARDAEIAARQEANRAARLADPASNGYMRERAAVEPKKERKVTREEDMSEEQLEARRRLKEKREAQKAARLAAEAESERQKDSIAAAAAATARKRWARDRGALDGQNYSSAVIHTNIRVDRPNVLVIAMCANSSVGLLFSV